MRKNKPLTNKSIDFNTYKAIIMNIKQSFGSIWKIEDGCFHNCNWFKIDCTITKNKTRTHIEMKVSISRPVLYDMGDEMSNQYYVIK